VAHDLAPFVLTLKLALVTTGILLIIGIPVAYWIAFTKSKWKYLVETLVSMPLVLPPTVLGFYLLIALGPKSVMGGFLASAFNVSVVFSFAGLVAGSVIFSLPFMINPLKAGFQSLPGILIDVSNTLGKSRRETLFQVILPNIKPALLTALVMTFAHTLGEFGVVLMIGGNIPHVTRTASIAVFSEVEALNYDTANFYALVMVAISFVILLSLTWFNRRQPRIL
jgi:molybdate transport system permease protein